MGSDRSKRWRPPFPFLSSLNPILPLSPYLCVKFSSHLLFSLCVLSGESFQDESGRNSSNANESARRTACGRMLDDRCWMLDENQQITRMGKRELARSLPFVTYHSAEQGQEQEQEEDAEQSGSWPFFAFCHPSHITHHFSLSFPVRTQALQAHRTLLYLVLSP